MFCGTLWKAPCCRAGQIIDPCLTALTLSGPLLPWNLAGESQVRGQDGAAGVAGTRAQGSAPEVQEASAVVRMANLMGASHLRAVDCARSRFVVLSFRSSANLLYGRAPCNQSLICLMCLLTGMLTRSTGSWRHRGWRRTHWSKMPCWPPGAPCSRNGRRSLGQCRRRSMTRSRA